MRKLIKVTQDDIDRGNRRMTTSCPIAIAVQKIENIEYAEVHDEYIHFFNKNDDKCYFSKLSKYAKNFIVDFDGLGEVKPFNFYLTLGEE